MLTLRQAGAVGIKLLGVSYLARTVLAGFSLAAMRFYPSDLGAEIGVVLSQGVGALGFPIAAWLLIGTADDLAAKLFPDTPIPASIAVGELLALGVALVGLNVAIASVPALVEGLGLAVYYGEASRQQLFEARFERQWPELIREALNLVTGVGVALASGPISRWLGPRRAQTPDAG